jgi:hypothetical protein
MECVNTRLSSQAADFFEACIKNLFLATTDSFPVVTTLRSS